jgi:DNA-nicking Smr family endonuclease
MGRKPRGLTESDRAAWAAYADRITPLPGRSPTNRPAPTARPEPGIPLEAPAPAVFSAFRPVPPPRQLSAARRPLAVGEAPGGVDGASWRRLRGGKFSPERRLDLHGLTVQRAYYALVAFLRAAQADQVRCVEVVTGRGSGDGTGVLRRELPLWLNLPDIRPLVLAAAYPHAANQGAVRLLLRRAR